MHVACVCESIDMLISHQLSVDPQATIEIDSRDQSWEFRDSSRSEHVPNPHYGWPSVFKSASY